MTGTLLVRVAATVVAAGSVVVGLQAGPPAHADPTTPIVLVSGRDDHGVEVADEVALRVEPDGAVIGSLPVDTLVRVHEEQQPWLRVSTITGEPVSGWVDDFSLRGALHAVVPDAPACEMSTPEGRLAASTQVRVVDAHATAGGLEVGVVPLTGGVEHHVPADWVRELAGPRPAPGQDCATVTDRSAPPHDH